MRSLIRLCDGYGADIFALLMLLLESLFSFFRHPEDPSQCQSGPLSLCPAAKTPGIPFALSGWRRLSPPCFKKGSHLEIYCSPAHAHTYSQSVTLTKAGMRQSSPERICGGSCLCVHVALFAALFTFVFTRIKEVFFFSFPCSFCLCMLIWHIAVYTDLNKWIKGPQRALQNSARLAYSFIAPPSTDPKRDIVAVRPLFRGIAAAHRDYGWRKNPLSPFLFCIFIVSFSPSCLLSSPAYEKGQSARTLDCCLSGSSGIAKPRLQRPPEVFEVELWERHLWLLFFALLLFNIVLHSDI